MLISFTVTNFRSFHEEQTLSMVANTRIKGHETHLRPIPQQDEQVLPTAIFYGANGAGKSNLTRALMLMQSLVVHGTRAPKGVPRNCFILAPEARTEPTVLEIRILAGGHLLEYGFKMTDEVILEEWLVRLSGKREEVIFERSTDEGIVTVNMPTSKALDKLLGGPKMRAQAQVGALPNQLFVSTVAKSIPMTEQGPVFQALYGWFSRKLRIIFPEAYFAGLPNFFRQNTEFQSFATSFLSNASTGVQTLEISSHPLAVPKFLEEQLAQNPSEADNLVAAAFADKLSSPGVELMPDGSVMGHFLQTEIGAEDHRAKLPLAEHSDGTRRIANLLPALFISSLEPNVLVVDEIDRSLHPLLARKFIEYFLAGSAGHQSQLILTTHDTNLLDLELFRRDEIWFTEKNGAGASHLYSLAQFKVRTDLKVDSGYLHGRFGAIPFLGGLDRLFPQPPTVKAAPKKRAKAAASS